MALPTRTDPHSRTGVFVIRDAMDIHGIIVAAFQECGLPYLTITSKRPGKRAYSLPAPQLINILRNVSGIVEASRRGPQVHMPFDVQVKLLPTNEIRMKRPEERDDRGLELTESELLTLARAGIGMVNEAFAVAGLPHYQFTSTPPQATRTRSKF